MLARFPIVLSAAALCLITGPARAQDQSRTPYSLKMDTRSATTTIWQKLARSNFPLDKPYAQLTADQVDSLKALYDPMPPGDEPPFPAAGLQTLVRSLSSAAAALEVRGALYAVATIGADGKALSVRVFKAPSAQMGDVLAKLMMLERYKPAKCGQQNCTMDFPFEAVLE